MSGAPALLDQQTERVPGRIGEHVERFALVLRAVIQQTGTQRLCPLAMPL